MKILQIAPLIESVPPKKYGGTERVIHALTEELVRRGHDVTLFASGNSETSANLVSVFPRGLREARVKYVHAPNVWTMLNIGSAYASQDYFDIIHDHNNLLSLPTANLAHKPVVMTLHGAFNPSSRKLFETLNKPYFVTISKEQFRSVPKINHIGTVYNGLDMESYPFSAENDGYLLFVGRICMEKGTHHAIDVAQYLNLPLIIAAKLDEFDVPYFKQYIEPRLSEQIAWIGEVNEEERNKLMSRALCMLHPVMWKEPFGLALIEAMACGCPVVAFKRGSIPEVIKDKETGFVVKDIDEMIEGVDNIDKIDRMFCRGYALENFNAKKMVDSYEAIYNKILGI